MATKKENINHQLKNELYNQFYSSKGTSRHEQKKITKEYAHHTKIYSRNSLKTHISRAKSFSSWIKETHPEIKKIEDISRDVAGRYLQDQQAKGYSTRTIEADMTMLNHINVGRNNWTKDQILNKKEFDINPRRAKDVTNNRGVKPSTRPYNEYQREIVSFGECFGLRKSELVPSKENNGYAVTTSSFFQKDERIYLAAIGKGGKFRTIECLESRQDYIKEEYGQYIQKVELFPERKEFKENYFKENQLFNSISNNVRIHVDCRQYYSNEKLDELENSDRRFELLPKNRLKSGKETYTTNNRTMLRDHAQYLSQQLGHERIYELKSYVNVNG